MAERWRVATPAGVTETERRALDAIDRDEVLTELVALLAVPSIGGTAAEAEIQQVLARRCERLDLEVDLWPLDLDGLAARADFPGVEVERDEGWGLVASLPAAPSGQPALVLQGHVDVVPAGDLARWSSDPFVPHVVRRGGQTTVRGRGACDMKAGVVANLAALAAVRRAGVTLPRGVALHLVVGEEDGGLGAYATLARGHHGAACIITEPTNGRVVTAAAGALTFRVEVPGVATHAATRDAGVSAIDAYLLLHLALHELERERNAQVEPPMRGYRIPYPLSVGRLEAGDWASSVPDRLVAEGRLGVRIAEDVTAARAALEERVAMVAAADPFLRDHPPVVTWSGGQFAGGTLPPAHPLARLVADAHADVVGQTRRPRGEPVEEVGVPYGSDLRLYAAAGVPTLHYGPGDPRLAHGPDEWVALEEVLRVTEVLVLCLLRCAGPDAG
jgi:acetylornithine deacetylase